MLHRLLRPASGLALLAVAATLSAVVARPGWSAPGRHAVLILVPGVPSEPFLMALSGPRFEPLRLYSNLGVMNSAVPGADVPPSAYLSLAAGRRLAWPDRMPDTNRAGLAASVAAAGRTVGYVGLEAEASAEGLGSLAAQSQSGAPQAHSGPTGPPGAAESWADAAQRLLPRSDLLVIDLPRGAASEIALELADRLSERLDRASDLLIVTSPDPGPPVGGQWMGLSPVLAWGGASPGGRLLTSPTTRTEGLIANIDLAPTLLTHLGVPVPEAMEGRVSAAGREGSAVDLLAFARSARATREAMTPALLAWGGICLLAVIAATIVLLRREGPGPAARARLALALLPAGPFGFLLAAINPQGTAANVLMVVAMWAGIAVVLSAAARPKFPPLLTGLGLLALVICMDLLWGGHLLARNLMSDFPNIGSRFYGIGNEYQGILLGALILLPFWAEQLRAHDAFSRERLRMLPLLWAFTTAIIGYPRMGADFGGALSMAIGFLAAYAIAWSLSTGKRLRPAHVAAGMAVVALVGGGLVALDLARPPELRTHVGKLAALALSGGWREVGEILARKAGLNVQMALTPYFLGGFAAVTPVAWLWYHKLGRPAWEVLNGRPLLKAGIKAALIGGLAAALLNDTGVIAGVMVLGCCLGIGLDTLLDAAGVPNPAGAASHQTPGGASGA